MSYVPVISMRKPRYIALALLVIFSLYYVHNILDGSPFATPTSVTIPITRISSTTQTPIAEVSKEKELATIAAQDAVPHAPVSTDHYPLSREDFVKTANQVSIPRFEPAPIQLMCSRNGKWNRNLVIECTEGLGGLNNVRQQILSCVRFAMEFKADLVFPVIAPRRESTSSTGVLNEYTRARELGILFDQQEFVRRLGEGCPQMRLYQNVTEVARVGNITKGNINPPTGANRTTLERFTSKWLHEHPAKKGKITVARLHRFATQYDVCEDGEKFANSFGQVVTLHKDAFYLASVVLFELSKRFKLEFDQKKPINPGAFIGIHLRTSADAVKEGWMSYEAQASMYQAYVKQYAYPVAYVASGNLSSTALFAKAIAPTPLVTKVSLLSKEDLALLDSMSWDQQAQVDYLVLLRSSRFLGMSDSNFSYAVAVARRTEGTVEGTCGVWARGDAETIPEPGLALLDELSIVIGKPSKYHFGSRSWP